MYTAKTINIMDSIQEIYYVDLSKEYETDLNYNLKYVIYDNFENKSIDTTFNAMFRSNYMVKYMYDEYVASYNMGDTNTNIVNGIHIVGNTIVEIVNKHLPTDNKLNNRILLDIHRPENFLYKNRLQNIISYANDSAIAYNLPVYMLAFPRTIAKIEEFNIDLGAIKIMDLLSFKMYLNVVYHSRFLISDSGTAQEEPALLNTPVIVPRDFTERPESVENNCSFIIDVNSSFNTSWTKSYIWMGLDYNKCDTLWLGNGTTSDKIINILKEQL